MKRFVAESSVNILLMGKKWQPQKVMTNPFIRSAFEALQETVVLQRTRRLEKTRM
jgi:hypothetical protein